MRIESMTATFGKLENQTLTFQPGLNVIPAPNEWGKSTWCAFLLAMLYGVDTKARSTQNTLSDKEHFAPWSGRPMSGKLELVWNGRRITVERSTKGRIPMGEFCAYETESGLSVPELTASNCGLQLLGVERSVFRRAGFIRLSDLPVTADEDLRRRLNALVTTGDESGEGQKLQKSLKELKSRICRKPGGQLFLLAQQRQQAEEALEAIAAKQQEHEALQSKMAQNAARQQALQAHRAALQYERAQRDWNRVRSAEMEKREAQQQLDEIRAACRDIPTRQEAEENCSRVEELRQSLYSFQQWQQSQPMPPVPPECPPCFAGLSSEEIRRKTEEDAASLRKKGAALIPLCVALLAGVACGVLLLAGQKLPAGIAAAVAGIAAICSVLFVLHDKGKRQMLAAQYGSLAPEQWQEQGEEYIADMIEYRQQEAAYRRAVEELSMRRQEMRQAVADVCGDRNPQQCLEYWQGVLGQWQALEDARARADSAAQQYAALRAMARPLPSKPQEDSCTETYEETEAALKELREQEQKLLEADNKLLGLMESMGQEQEIRMQMQQQEERLEALSRYVSAIDLAQKTLEESAAELQRRFAPRISQLGQRYLSRLTLGKYDRLVLSANLALRCGSAAEATLREPLWRSEGTVDQLYLALRLAVAQELTPEAPLVLDDALVRFDEVRLQAALDLLQEIAGEKQVILFTCQNREMELLKDTMG